MKLCTHIARFASCLDVTSIGLAQAAAKPDAYANIPDAVTEDSKHYTVEFENEFARVLRIRYYPHEIGNMHNHPHSATVFLTDGKLEMTMPDAKLMVSSPKAGQVVFEEAGPHRPENLTDQPFESGFAFWVEWVAQSPRHKQIDEMKGEL